MRTVHTVAGLRDALHGHRRAGHVIGLVPTMGFLHEGHLELIRRARQQADVVVVSLFVNPTQFDDPGDLDAYPRDEERDALLAQGAGADLLFAPPAEEIYPPGFATTVSVRGVSEPLEGAGRGLGHFDGVTTVVTKLLNMVGPDVAFFGRKDAQQALVVRRLVRDLDMPVRIEVVPTVREADGLAMSSRNARLTPADRERALALHRGLQAAERAVAAGERSAAVLRDLALAPIHEQGIEPMYVEVVDAETLQRVERVDGDALLAVAARVGDVRLIDNTVLSVPAAADVRPGDTPAATLTEVI